MASQAASEQKVNAAANRISTGSVPEEVKILIVSSEDWLENTQVFESNDRLEYEDERFPQIFKDVTKKLGHENSAQTYLCRHGGPGPSVVRSNLPNYKSYIYPLRIPGSSTIYSAFPGTPNAIYKGLYVGMFVTFMGVVYIDKALDFLFVRIPDQTSKNSEN